MEVKNKAKSFLGVVLTDPSLKRLIFFGLTASVIWFLPIYKVLMYTIFQKYTNLSLVDNKVYDYFTTITIILTYYIALLRKNIGGTAKSVLRNQTKLKGKCVVVTGGYKGLGLAAVKEFLRYGCEVVLACRSPKHMELVSADLLSKFPNAKITCIELELGSYKSIENCAKTILAKFPKIDIIINNAGFLNQRLDYINGVESTFFINYLGHFYLTNLLYKRIVTSHTLVVNLSSIAHSMLCESDVSFDFIYENNSASRTAPSLLYRREYNFSKLCMLLYTQQLQKRFEKEKTEACAVSVNPGLVKTEIFRNEQSWFRALCKNITFPKTPLQGAQTILYVCLVDRWELAKGCYYSDCKVDHVRAYATDTKRAEELWSLSEKILANRAKM
ncbi:putative oxidoreductase, short-chain dehydrogenase family, putative [Plasmodium ovale]|uniref:Putative oxidoreductase, short-chain dehydrogenase family, putative n=1 Tax=Plasmodium ovale TaxID=36330 RepID=A0A1D3TJA6_PLAOA|nr:putative oxidoreductase, short-chain dehydrogenase family, putative [Plasmodium ovale]